MVIEHGTMKKSITILLFMFACGDNLAPDIGPDAQVAVDAMLPDIHAPDAPDGGGCSLGNLPLSRTVTLNPGDPWPSSLGNELQDASIKGTKGLQTAIIGGDAFCLSRGSVTKGFGASSVVWTFPTSSEAEIGFSLSTLIPVGGILKDISLSWRKNSTSAGQLQAQTIAYVFPGVSVSNVAAFTVSAPTGVTTVLTAMPGSPDLTFAANTAYSLTVAGFTAAGGGSNFTGTPTFEGAIVQWYVP